MSEPVRLALPLGADEVRALRVGRQVLLSGKVITARDAAHRYLVERSDADAFPFDLARGAVYHCGPVVRDRPSGWEILSAGPTTSMRMEMYQADVLSRYDIAVVIGKGGMGKVTAAALADTPAVYLAAPSGAGALLAQRIAAVAGVCKLEEFGSPEALWCLEVTDFPAVVAMDCAGGNLYGEVERASREALDRLLRADSGK
ncbi:MAG: FumA C-terminus/TtdB family hydratase beta subunit [Planctomycetota bacterium]|jgi:fumarate hydratase class I